jgi:hypothetical protein
MKLGQAAKAQVVGNLACRSSHAFAQDILALLQDDEHRRSVAIQVRLEFFFACLHLIDRAAFLSLGQRKRTRFFNSCYDDAVTFIADDLPEHVASEFANNHMHAFNSRQRDWGHYQHLLPDTNVLPKDTLFWNLSKEIASAAKAGDNLDVLLASYNRLFTFFETILKTL